MSVHTSNTLQSHLGQLPRWQGSSHLWSPQLRSFPHTREHMWSTSMQHLVLHLWRPQWRSWVIYNGNYYFLDVPNPKIRMYLPQYIKKLIYFRGDKLKTEQQYIEWNCWPFYMVFYRWLHLPLLSIQNTGHYSPWHHNGIWLESPGDMVDKGLHGTKPGTHDRSLAHHIWGLADRVGCKLGQGLYMTFAEWLHLAHRAFPVAPGKRDSITLQ